MVKLSNFVIEVLYFRVPVDDDGNEVIVSDEELLNEKYFYKITTSQNYIEKHKRLLEFAKLRNYENKFLK